LLSPTKATALGTFHQYKGKPESIIRSVMQGASGYPFYNLSKLEFRPSQKGVNSLLDDPSNLAPNVAAWSLCVRCWATCRAEANCGFSQRRKSRSAAKLHLTLSQIGSLLLCAARPRASLSDSSTLMRETTG